MQSSVSSKIHHLLVMLRIPSTRSSEVLPILAKQRVQQVQILPFSDGEKDQLSITFTCSKPCAQEIRISLLGLGIGTPLSGTDINILSLAIPKDMRNAEEKEIAATVNENDPLTSTASVKPSIFSDAFQSSIKARIAVENMLELVHEGASFSFDYLILIICAGMIALIGLLTNSSVSLVASMLVSPMMGPILGFTFGTVVRDRNLILVGLRTELLSFLICMGIGFIGGLCAAPSAMVSQPWPTIEMSNRAEPTGLYVGAAIAIPSGVAVALSIMGQNTNSLVGVAISASLLPPCVNCGLLFAQATLSNYYYQLNCISNNNANGGSYNRTTWEKCCDVRALCPDNGVRQFCCWNTANSPSHVAAMGGISAALTMVNIACIWIFAALMFYLKEVAPLPNKSELWTSLVPKARQFNMAVNRGDIKQDEIAKEVDRQREQAKVRPHLERQVPIGRGGLQTEAIGTAGGAFVFPTTNVRGSKKSVFRELAELFDFQKQQEEEEGLEV